MENVVVCLALMTMASVVYMVYSHQSTLRVHRTSHLNEAASHFFDDPSLSKKFKVSTQEAKSHVRAATPASVVTQSLPESFEEIPVKRPRDSGVASSERVTNKAQTASQPEQLTSEKLVFRGAELEVPTPPKDADNVPNESGTQSFFAEGVRLPPPRFEAPARRLSSRPSPVSIPYVLPADFQAAESSSLTGHATSLAQLGRSKELVATRLRQSQTTEEVQAASFPLYPGLNTSSAPFRASK